MKTFLLSWMAHDLLDQIYREDSFDVSSSCPTHRRSPRYRFLSKPFVWRSKSFTFNVPEKMEFIRSSSTLWYEKSGELWVKLERSKIACFFQKKLSQKTILVSRERTWWLLWFARWRSPPRSDPLDCRRSGARWKSLSIWQKSCAEK